VNRTHAAREQCISRAEVGGALPGERRSSSRSDRYRELGKVCGIPQFSPYPVRHAYTTEALERGMSSDIVAKPAGGDYFVALTWASGYPHRRPTRTAFLIGRMP
jgi:hypothetical protein